MKVRGWLGLFANGWQGWWLMGEWTPVKLCDVANLSGGHAFKSTQYADSGRFVLRTVNIRDDYSITKDGAVFIPEAEASEYERFSLQDKDTLFVMVAATLGKVGLVRENVLPALLNQNMWVIRAIDGKIDPTFLHFLFRGLSKIPLSWVSGSARSFLRRNDVRNLDFLLPSDTEQRAIAAVLSALDDKIELNRRMNATLEAMARAIFRDWFVTFGPTRAKMAGAPPYLPPETWSLFPSRLDENSVPEGWEEKPLSEFFSILGGGTPKTKEPAYWGGNIPWYSVVDAPNGSDVYVHDTEKKITDRGLQESSAKLVREGITIISARGTVGKLAMAAQEMTFNQSCYGLQGEGKAGDCFTYLAAQRMVSRLQAMAHGSVFSTITRATFQSLNLAKPKDRVFEAFEQAAQPLFEKMKANGKESRTLAQTRDLLLPKLMSGEIRVGEAAGIVEEAV
jgi:type I restriction enzyme, S subunit